MDSTNTTTTNDLPLERVVALAVGELERLGYSRRSRDRFRATWRRLLAFAQDNDLGPGYSDELATRFVDAFRPPVGERLEPGDHWRRNMVYDVKVLGDFKRDRRIVPYGADKLTGTLPRAMKKPLRDYERYCTERLRLRPTTLAGRIREIAQFLHFLHSMRNVETPRDMQPGDVSAFVVSREHYRSKTISGIVSCVRQFLKFLTMRGTLRQDLSQALPTVRIAADATIRPVWEPEAVVRLLEAIDRSSPRGKRDYAILLLAARLGLRPGDIAALRLDDLDWEAATVNITQSKTGAPLRLPLSEEVGEALIDYLRFGRAKTEHRQVFLKLASPVEPFHSGKNLYQLMARWRYAAKIDNRKGQPPGLYSLRHNLATQLLREEVPIHVISEILGHAASATTMIYAKADTEALRGAALDTEEAHHVE